MECGRVYIERDRKTIERRGIGLAENGT